MSKSVEIATSNDVTDVDSFSELLQLPVDGHSNAQRCSAGLRERPTPVSPDPEERDIPTVSKSVEIATSNEVTELTVLVNSFSCLSMKK